MYSQQIYRLAWLVRQKKLQQKREGKKKHRKSRNASFLFSSFVVGIKRPAATVSIHSLAVPYIRLERTNETKSCLYCFVAAPDDDYDDAGNRTIGLRPTELLYLLIIHTVRFQVRQQIL